MFAIVKPNFPADNSDLRPDVHLMWHELSHSFGCKHNSSTDLCTYGQLCCMSTGYDMVEKLDLRTIWCDACASNYFKPEYLD
jgi:hypothetical protein